MSLRANSESEALSLLAPHRTLLLAISGGPDSVALMILAAKWAERASHEIMAATVDHGLRPESRSEAEQVGAWASSLGFRHHLLTWNGAKPSTRIQERAREARYDLLSECAEKIGATAMVTAHHADDQAETILFRLTRGSGVAGLAGMAVQSRCGDVALLRPLLGFGKSELVAICERAEHGYFRDPSNADEHYARARLRKLRPLLAEQGLDNQALLRLGQRAARADAALSHCVEAALGRAIVDADSERTRFDAAALRESPLEIIQRLLSREIGRLAPGSRLRLERIERAAQRLAASLSSGERLRLTIADLLLESHGGFVTLRPAPPRRPKTENPEAPEG